MRKSFASLFREAAEWSDAIFGANRSPMGPLKHLAKEVTEAQEKPSDITEYADMILLVMNAAHCNGWDGYALLEAVDKKLQINKQRKWGALNSEGISEHVKEEAISAAKSKDVPGQDRRAAESLAKMLFPGKGKPVFIGDV